MKKDRNILIGLTVFICSLLAITIIDGTYAYPLTMQNTDDGKIIPLGNEGGTSQCWECDGNQVTGTTEYPPQWTCESGWKVCSDSTPSPSPSIKPSPSPSPSIKPSPSPTEKPRPSVEPDPEYPSCYICSTDKTNYEWGLYDDLSNSCTGRWIETNNSRSECEYVAPTSPSPNSYCYVCSTNDNVFYWGIYPGPSAGSNSCEGSWNVTAKTYNQCRAEEIPSNPNTGDVMLYIAYLVGFSSLFYSGYSFYRYKKQNINK